jgi:hypothetical protein
MEEIKRKYFSAFYSLIAHERLRAMLEGRDSPLRAYGVIIVTIAN